MKAKEFKMFMERLQEANEYDPIWYAGYLWINLTEKQCEQLIKLLKVHPSVIRSGNVYRLPSGLELTHNA